MYSERECTFCLNADFYNTDGPAQLNTLAKENTGKHSCTETSIQVMRPTETHPDQRQNHKETCKQSKFGVQPEEKKRLDILS